jgi:hypothetical protein
MTFARKITITRILMVPVFAGFALAYGGSVKAGLPDEALWTVSSVPYGAEECSVRGVGFDQMWGDADIVDLGKAMRAAVGVRRDCWGSRIRRVALAT